MIPPLDPTTLPGPAQKIVGDGAPPQLRLMAAKGIVPGLRPDAILSVLVLLSRGADAAVRDQATKTLKALPDPLLKGAIGAPLPAAVIDVLARYCIQRLDVVEALVQMPAIHVETVAMLAQYGGELVVELVATNEERILAHPEIIEAIYLNNASRMSTANRLVELAVRNGIELTGIPAWKEVAMAIQGELIAEPSEEPLPEDMEFWEHDYAAQQLGLGEEVVKVDDEGEEEVVDEIKPLYRQIQEASIATKVRWAMLGSREMRSLLIREQNKLVACAAAHSPKLQESEVVQITRSRGVIEDVLRIIARSPEWMKSYTVKRNLVENAKTPIQIATALIPHLREAELRRLTRNRNVPSPVRMAARRHLERRGR
ncbi:MAG: hypothetical protein R3B72_13600 [Polyangiaceae bacterium]